MKKSFLSATWFPWFVCGIGALFYAYEYFLRVTPSVMQTELMHTFSINNALFGFLSACYYYAYTPMQIPVGVLMDHYGPRRLLTVACLFCVFGTLLFSVQVFAVAALGRFLVGFGSAFAFVGVLKLAALWLPKNRFALIAGLATALGMLGPTLGDILLTPMVHIVGWHDTVFITAIIGVILTGIIWFYVSDQGIMKEASIDQDIPKVNGLRAQIQHLAHMLKFRQVWLSGLIAACLFLPITVFAELWGIPYLEQAKGLSPVYASWINPLLFIGFSIGGIVFGYLSDKINRRKGIIILGNFLALIAVSLLIYVSHLSVLMICVLLFVLGLSTGVEVITFAVSRESVSEHATGTAIAMTNFLTMLGGMIFQPILGQLLDFHALNISHHAVTNLGANDYQFALTVIPVCLLFALILCCFLYETGGGEYNIEN